MKKTFPANFVAMAERFYVPPTESIDVVERAAANVQADDIRFGRDFFYLTASVLAWGLFWQLADRHQDNQYVQYLAWGTVFVAAWLTYTF